MKGYERLSCNLTKVIRWQIQVNDYGDRCTTTYRVIRAKKKYMRDRSLPVIEIVKKRGSPCQRNHIKSPKYLWAPR